MAWGIYDALEFEQFSLKTALRNINFNSSMTHKVSEKCFFFGAPKSISSFTYVQYLGVTAGIEPAA
jgi:hypothetical protein